MHMEKAGKNLKTSNCVEEFSSCLDHILKGSEVPMVWIVEGDKRKVFKGRIKLNVKSHNVFEFESESNDISLEKNQQIFFKYALRDLLFRATVIGVKKGRILVGYPKEYRIEENRDLKRHGMEEGLYNVVVDKKDDEIIGKTSFSLKLLDMSPMGVGLLVSVTKKDCFKRGEELLLKSIGKMSFERPLVCKICHVTPMHESLLTVRDYKLGLYLEEPFEERVMDFFLPSF